MGHVAGRPHEARHWPPGSNPLKGMQRLWGQRAGCCGAWGCSFKGQHVGLQMPVVARQAAAP